MYAKMMLVAAGLLTAPQIEAGVWDSIKSVFIAEEEVSPPAIRALVLKDAPRCMLEVKGAFNVYDPYKNDRLSTRFSSKKALLQSTGYGLKWGEDFPDIYQLKIVPDSPLTTVLIDGIEYKGEVIIYDVEGSLSVVNEVDIEEYITSVLSPLFNEPLSKEAMNALVIAARTGAYHAANHAQNPYWHVDGMKEGYMGYAVTKKRNGVEKAVFDTRYMVLNTASIYGKNKEIATFPTSIVSKKGTQEKQGVFNLSIDEVEKIAQKGVLADRILTQVFPNSHISLTHNTGVKSNQALADRLED